MMHVPIEAVEPGMRSAVDIHNPRDPALPVLLRRRHVMDARLIARLRDFFHMKSIWIENDDLRTMEEMIHHADERGALRLHALRAVFEETQELLCCRGAPRAYASAVRELCDRLMPGDRPSEETMRQAYLETAIALEAGAAGAITDVARAFVTKTTREGKMPVAALCEIRAEPFDARFKRTLLSIAPPFPLGRQVTLGDGRMGAVIDFDPKNPCAPPVRVKNLDGSYSEVFTPQGARSIIRYEGEDCAMFHYNAADA